MNREKPKCAHCEKRADVVIEDVFYKCAECWLSWMNAYLPKKDKENEKNL